MLLNVIKPEYRYIEFLTTDFCCKDINPGSGISRSAPTTPEQYAFSLSAARFTPPTTTSSSSCPVSSAFMPTSLTSTSGPNTPLAGNANTYLPGSNAVTPVSHATIRLPRNEFWPYFLIYSSSCFALHFIKVSQARVVIFG